MTPRPVKAERAIPLLLGIVSLVAALWAGLLRLGFELPAPQSALGGVHGPLMVSGFLGTLISLERAVAIGMPWAYAARVATGVGALMLIAGIGGATGPMLVTLGSLALLVIFVTVLERQTEIFTVAMAVGALAWFVGNALWFAGQPIPDLVYWWSAFFVLTIAGERLELSRMRAPLAGSRLAFLLSALLVILGPILSSSERNVGPILLGLGMIGFAGWIAVYDVARKTIRQSGLPRFVAINLLLGALWLGVSGIAHLALVVNPTNFQYDIALHSLFVGFVFSMIFAHAPIIFPAILGRELPFCNRFYGHVALLQASLALRVGGDLVESVAGWQWGGVLNAIAILLFLVNTVTAIASASRSASERRPELALPHGGGPSPAKAGRVVRARFR